MSFIAVPPAAAAEAPIDCGTFLPPVDPAAARQRMRLDGTVTPERLREALVEAASAVADALDDWAEAKALEGYATLAAVPARQIDGASAHVHRYHRAVRSIAAASLIERMRNYDTTNDGHLEADKLTPTIDELRRDAHWAINDILGIQRTTVELI